MKSKVLVEMQQLFEQKTLMNINIPMPSYLFVQCYGRSIEDEMDEITESLGKKEWFIFKTDRKQKDGSVLQNFLMEQERHAALGKSFAGCVLVELSGETDEKELFEFLDYIQNQEKRLKCIYTTKNLKEVEQIKHQLEAHFFVRSIQGDCLEEEEQLELFRQTLEQYQFYLEEDAYEEAEYFFKTKEWLETDMVITTIQNIAKSIVYDKMIVGKEIEWDVSRMEVKEAIKKYTKETNPKRQIGFVQEV